MRVTIDTRSVRGCAKPGCYERQPYFRHHKGHDGLIGRFNRKIKRGYFKFFYRVDLCDKHHMEIHYLYQEHIQTWRKWTSRGVLKLRKKLIAVCNAWLQHNRVVFIPDDFQREWHNSQKAWKIRQEVHQARMLSQQSSAQKRAERLSRSR